MPVSHKNVHRNTVISVLAATAVAAFLRFHDLSGKSIWNDEVFTIDVARQPIGEIQSFLVTHFHHPPFYFTLVHSVFSAMGESIWSLRFLSALFGTLTVGAVVMIAGSRWTWKEGAVAGLLCALSPFHLAYSQEGRPYALAGLLALLSCHFFLRLLERDELRVKPWYSLSTLGYGLSTLALIYTHHWGIFVICAQAIVLFTERPYSWKKIRPAIVAVGIVVLLYIPELPALKTQSVPGSVGAWFWAESPSVNEALGLLGAYSGSYFRMASSVYSLPAILRIVSGVSLLALVGFIVIRSMGSADAGMTRFAKMTAVILLVPFCVSFFRPEIFLWYRHTVIVLPLLFLLVGGVAATGRYQKSAYAAILIMSVTALIGVAYYYRWDKSNIRAVATYLTELTSEERTMIIRPASVGRMMDYYYTGNAERLDEAYLDTQLGEIVDTARAFVYVSLDVPNPIREYMDGHFDKKSERVFPGIAHMGIIVGSYAQKPDPEIEEVP